MNIPLYTEGKYAATEYIQGGIPMGVRFSKYSTVVPFVEPKQKYNFNSLHDWQRYPDAVVFHTPFSPWHSEPYMHLPKYDPGNEVSNKRMWRLIVRVDFVPKPEILEALREQQKAMKAKWDDISK